MWGWHWDRSGGCVCCVPHNLQGLLWGGFGVAPGLLLLLLPPGNTRCYCVLTS